MTIERQLVELKAVHRNDAGVYECCAMNVIDTACTNFTMSVNSGMYKYVVAVHLICFRGECCHCSWMVHRHELDILACAVLI